MGDGSINDDDDGDAAGHHQKIQSNSFKIING
jgi:hypothetical protein